MNSDQTTGMLDRAATVLATWFLGWLVQRHYISTADSAAFLPIVIAVPAAFWGWYRNRAASIVAAASSLPEVKAITVNSLEMANAARAADPATTVTVKP